MPDGAPLIDPDIIARRIDALLIDRRPGAAKPLLAALEKLAPDHENLALLRAGYWCQLQDPAQALVGLAEALAGHPKNAVLWLRQAEIFFAQDRFDDAAQSAARAVLLAPALTSAKLRLGLALMRLGQFDQALFCLKDSFSADPGNVENALALAALSPAGAIEILNGAITANAHVVLRNALTRRYLCTGNAAQAMRTAQQAIGEGVGDAQSHCLLAFAQMQAADWNEAALSAGRARSIAPDNLWAARLGAALYCRQGGRLCEVPPDDADIAEQALIAGGAIAPGAFRALIEGLEFAGPVLDVCCGPGLNAIAAQGIETGPWTGVDLSPAMITRCAERGLYAGLRQSDPLRLPGGSAEYAVILLNEALAWLESPQAFLDIVRSHLTDGGVALAAVAIGRAGMSGHGLFAHREAAIAQYAAGAGLSFEAPRSGVLRHLEGIPIHGVIACFRAL